MLMSLSLQARKLVYYQDEDACFERYYRIDDYATVLRPQLFDNIYILQISFIFIMSEILCFFSYKMYFYIYFDVLDCLLQLLFFVFIYLFAILFVYVFACLCCTMFVCVCVCVFSSFDM